MSLFKSEPVNSPILNKYLTMSTRFQNIGIAIVLAAILINYFGGPMLKTPSIILFIPGALSLVFGGSSLQPHNLIKAFAQQCSNDPNQEMAEAFLETLTRAKKIRLTGQSIQIVNKAIAVYGACEDADPELVRKLESTAKAVIQKKIL